MIDEIGYLSYDNRNADLNNGAEQALRPIVLGRNFAHLRIMCSTNQRIAAAA